MSTLWVDLARINQCRLPKELEELSTLVTANSDDEESES